MTSLRHYHLGGGEALRSRFDSLREQRKPQGAVHSDKAGKSRVQDKQDKQH